MYITTRVTITVHATADDWRLYDLPGREDAAIALNQRFEGMCCNFDRPHGDRPDRSTTQSQAPNSNSWWMN